ncbi:recombinase family protein [Bradyrhizobium sp. URHD0069]|uniref:recombinase family protein n=1 Tax=Bradyrhizobium sp. URHD0069 TaxID=1380355 RepID=UPI000691616B|nr:recombinase family protein [Bradyrhizobium sp. URHD0069]
MNASETRPKAYSYLRFSSPEQMKGDSLRRQWEASKAYASRHGLDLDQNLTFHDMGVSGFKGANVQRGALGLFRRGVEDGLIVPGSYLLVEDFDRLSRMDPWEAMGVFSEIINSGVTVVTLKDERVWTREGLKSNPFQIMESLLAMWNGHQESVKKSMRLAAVHEGKRQRLLVGGQLEKPYKRGPAWLRWNEATKAFELIEERAAVVRRIFDLADQGRQPDTIARALNAEDMPTWSTSKRTAEFWRGSYVRKVLINPAAAGTLVMHRTGEDEKTRARRDKVEASIKAYYPAAVSEELFERLAERRKSIAPRGRYSGTKTASIIAGLGKCVKCGSTVLRVSKGEYVYLVCTRASAKGDCEYKAVPYSEVETAMIENWRVLVEEAPRGADTDEIDTDIINAEEALSTLRDTYNLFADEFAETRSFSSRTRMREAARELESEEQALKDLKARRDRLSAPYVLKRIEALGTALQAQPLDVHKANLALRAVVDRIVFDVERSRITFHWRDSEQRTYLMINTGKHSRVFDSSHLSARTYTHTAD